MNSVSKFALSGVVASVLLFNGCRPSETSNKQSAPEQEQQSKEQRTITQIGVAYALGGKGDLSYNDAANKGVIALRQQGVYVREFEPVNLDDYAKGLDLLSLNDFQLIFCVGYLYDEPVSRVGKNHPNTLFVVLDGNAALPPNVSSIKFNAKEGSFLAGVVAGKISRAGKVAFIGGANIPIINEFLSGFRDGVKWVAPNTDVKAFYVGTGGAAFTDPVKGREVALTAIQDGVDLVFPAAGSSGNGVIKAAQEREIKAIGVDVDQSHLAPETVVTSMMKNFDVAMLNFLNQLKSGESVAGRNLIMGVAEGAVSLAPLSTDAKNLVGDALQRGTEHVLSKKESAVGP